MNFLSILALFRKGSSVADPEAWKDKTTLAVKLGAVIIAAAQVAKGFGYATDFLTPDVVTQLSGGIVGVWLVISHFITSDKAGILPAKPTSDNGESVDLRGGP